MDHDTTGTAGTVETVKEDIGAAQDEIVHEEVRAEYVFWLDYLESPARSWREVRWAR